MGMGIGQTIESQKVLAPFSSKHMHKVSFIMYFVRILFFFILFLKPLKKKKPMWGSINLNEVTERQTVPPYLC